jgi:hypothetical protein
MGRDHLQKARTTQRALGKGNMTGSIKQMGIIGNSSPRESESYSQEHSNLTVKKTIRTEYLHASSTMQQPSQ